MENSSKVTLVVCTLNEIDGMRAIMPKIKREYCDQIIIMDGGSTDGTIEYAQENNYFVYIQKKPGFRHGYAELLPLVKGDIILTFSPDGNSIPEVIPELVHKMEEGYDMVIASRYLGDARSEDDDLITGFGNWLFTKSVNFFHGGHYTDVMVLYRAYKKQIVYDLNLHQDEGFALPEKLFATRISWEPLLSIRAAKRKLKVTEIAADEPPRIGGTRKLQILRWGAAYYFQIIREIWHWRT
jgi:glycosyltransferase involved in cell wall biosynthesis